jgi:capsular exopolysaccharide synthesis family protein
MQGEHQHSVDYVRFVRRIIAYRWRIILGVFLAVAVPGVVATLLATEPLYEASATLFLLPERSEPAFLRDFASAEGNALYIALLRSRSLAQAVIEALPKESRDELVRRVMLSDYLLAFTNALRRYTGADVVVYSPTEIATRELQEARTSFTIGKDGVVTITSLAFSPRVAVDLANTYVEVLLSRSSSFSRQQAQGTRELLENLWGQAKTSQREAEEALRTLQARPGSNLKLPEESKLELAALGNLESQIADVQVDREIAQNKLAYLKGDRKRGGGPALDPAAQALRERLLQLEAKLGALTEKYTEQHPSVQSTRAEVQETQERLAAVLKPQQAPKPGGSAAILKPIELAQLSKQMASLDVDVMSLQAKEDSLKERASRLRQSLAVMNAREQEYSERLRSVTTQARLTDVLADKLTAARLSEQSYIKNIQVIDLATLPRQPSSRGPIKLLLIAIVSGLGLGIVAAALRDYATQVIETEQDVKEATGLTVLGSIPFAERSEAVAVGSGTSRALPALFAGERHALPAEACRAMRVALECQGLERRLRTLLVTSPGAHEGKSTVLINLGRAFLEADRSLLIIDADLRRPALHGTLQVPNEIGLADAVREGTVWPEAFRRIVPGLDFIPAGIKPENPSGLLASRHMSGVLEQARQRADLVLIDAPPVLAVADCLPLCRQVDGVLLVARYGSTRRRSLRRAKAQLEQAGAHIVGVVINGLSRRETRLYYSEYARYVGIARRRKERKRRP